MGNIIRHKRSLVSGHVPTAEQLLLGEIAINSADGILFTKKSDGTIVNVSIPQVVDGGEITYDSLLGGLMAFWTMQESVGSRRDTSGNSKILFDSNLSAGYESGLSENSLRLSRRNALYCNDGFSDRKSISIWVKLESAPDQTEVLLRVGTGSSDDTTFSVTQSGSFVVSCKIGSETVEASTQLNTGSWTHVVVMKKASQIEIYNQGTSDSSSPCSGEWHTPSNSLLFLGPFGGVVQLDCLGIWSRELTLDEISRLGGLPAFSLEPYQNPLVDESQFAILAVSSTITSMTFSVAGSSGTLFPEFAQNVHDYGILTNTSVNGTQVSYTVDINGQQFSGLGSVGEIIRIADGTTSYYIRLLPSDMTLGEIVLPPTEDYIPGYYMATGRRDISTPPNYNIIYNEYGLPVWYQVCPSGSPQINQPGNDANTLVVCQRGTGGPRYTITMTNDSLLGKTYNMLPTTKNGHAYQYDWQQHELIQISGPPARRGNIIGVAFIATPASNTSPGQQAIADKAYGVYIQEQTPTGTIAWEWWSGDHFNATTAARNSSFFHLNALDVHPITGDILLSFRGCSALLCVDYATKAVKWIVQGVPQAIGTLASVADPVATANTKFLQLEGEPTTGSYQFIGTAGQHHIKWRINVDPLTTGNEVISVFDNQTNFFQGNNTNRTVSLLTGTGTTATATTSSAHGFANGDYVQVSGASQSAFNGVFQVAVVNTTKFTYSSSASGTATGSVVAVKATNYFPGAGPKARGVMYEIDLNLNKAIHRSSVVADIGPSGYLGSYTVLEHPDGRYSHVLDWNGMHPVLAEYSDAGDGTSPGEKTFVMDLPGDYYRIIKVPKEFFDINYMRATTAIAITQQ